MKPIFEDERELLIDLLKVDIPKESWRKAHAIYLDMDAEKPYFRFKVDNGKAWVTTNNIQWHKKKYTQKGWKKLIDENKQKLNDLYLESTKSIRDYILNNPDVHIYSLGYSSGKDSTINLFMWLEALKIYPEILNFLNKNNIKWEIQMCNTSNDTADTYKNIQQVVPKILKKYGLGSRLVGYKGNKKLYSKIIYDIQPMVDIVILSPDVGFYDWIIHEKDYFIPTVMVRNCCSTYKEGQTDKFYPNDKKVVIVTGVRRFESRKRKHYQMVMDNDFRVKLFGRSSYPEKWVSFSPVINWRDEDVWLYILQNDIPINPMYYVGFHRVGCLMCPFQQNYIDLIIKKHYPEQHYRWMNILKENYERKNVKDRLKWSLEEYQNGKWKTGISKIYEITSLKATPERVKEVSEILGVSEDIAKRYFQRKCGECGKKLNPGEIGMFLKTQGRYENQVDDREYLCKKHLSELLGITGKEYVEMRNSFTEQGCDLF